LSRAAAAQVPSCVACQSRLGHVSEVSKPCSAPVSTRARGKGQPRRRTRRGASQWGQVTWASVVAVRCGCAGVAPVGEGSICRIGAVVMRQWACIQPQWRTFMHPAGRPWGRTRRLHARTSRRMGRGRARPGVRAVKGTRRSCRPTLRRLAMATVQPAGARYGKAVAPWGGAGRWTCPGVGQRWGAICARCPAVRLSCVKSARQIGARARPGTEQVVLEGNQASRSWESPPPGTMAWMWGCYGSGRPQGGRIPGKPGSVGPTPRGAWARRVSAWAEAGPRVGSARRGGARQQGRSASGTGPVSRQDGPGRGGSCGLGRHCPAL
jgi:hypothetical protein